MPAFDRTISVVLTGAREQIRQAEIRTAQEAVARVVRESHPSAVEMIVDGVPGRRIEDVQPFGTIEVHFGYGTEIVSLALEILRALSPVKTGAYQRSHQVYINGAMVSDIADVGAADHIVIASTLPYSRKIEGGLRFTGWNSGHRGHYDADAMKRVGGESSQAPDGVYQLAAETLSRRFGNSYNVTFSWAGPSGEPGAGRYPALVIDRIAA